MPRHQLTLVVPKVSGPRGCAFSAPPGYDGLTRRDFLATSAATAIGALLVGCGGGKNLIGPPPPTGTITGDVVDLTGARQPSLGQIYLMYENGLQSGRSVAVDAAGRFAFSDVPTGPWQLRFHAPGIAYVPEEFPHPVRVTVTADRTTTVRIVTERGWEDGSPMVEIYIGDYFFQAQPLGSPNAETIVKVGTPICWYNVGLTQHTTTGGRWDSGALNRTASYIWVPDRVGIFPYTCAFHGTQMIASLRIQS